MRLIAEPSPKGTAFLYRSEYWQTCCGKRMNQPRKALVLKREAAPEWTKDREHEWEAEQIIPEIPGSAGLAVTREFARYKGPGPVSMKGVIGYTFEDCLFVFTRAENQGSGVNLEFCRDITFIRCGFRCLDIGDIQSGGSGYGAVVSGCSDVIFRDCWSEDCHIGAMVTDSSRRVQVHGWESRNTHKPVDIHGGGCQDMLFSAVRGAGAIAIGNPDLPDGATGVSVTDCETDALEFHGKIRVAKAQRSTFKEVRMNHYRARPTDSQVDYSMNQIVIDGTTRYNSLVVHTL